MQLGSRGHSALESADTPARVASRMASKPDEAGFAPTSQGRTFGLAAMAPQMAVGEIGAVGPMRRIETGVRASRLGR
jgi:hypothetical protein